MADSGSADDPEAFDYNLPLTALFGDHPKTEILAAMLTGDDHPPTAFSANEVSRIAGLEEASVEEHVADLLDLGIVVRADGMAEGEYELADDSHVVDDVRRLNDDLAEVVFSADGV